MLVSPTTGGFAEVFAREGSVVGDHRPSREMLPTIVDWEMQVVRGYALL
jgi:hypothetical protein